MTDNSMKTESRLSNVVFRGFLAVLLLTSLDCTAVKGPEPPAVAKMVSEMTIVERESLERRIGVIANKVANSKQYLHDDTLPIHIRASFDSVNESLIMNTDERLGQSSGYPDVENMQSAVQDAIWPLLEGIPSFWGLDWRYGGKDMYFWFPQDRTSTDIRERRSPLTARPEVAALVSAGHGYYYHHGYSDWRAQRQSHHGVLEDEITTVFSSVLSAHLRYKGIAVNESRPSNFSEHAPSSQPFYMIAARYRIQDSMPDRPDIWHSLPDDASDLREYNEDIRSRPLYANAMGVDASIHLHTNADVSSDARGTKVFVQPGRPDSSKLGGMVLCYMREQVRSIEKYREFPVARAPIPKNHGENRLAKMPSVIVEVGFHTNVDDVAAMKDRLFVAASMRGLAKGYRLFRDGKACEDFTIEMPSSTTGFVGDIINIPVVGKGYPELPVIMEGKPKECESGICSTAYGVAFDEYELSHANVQFDCSEDDADRSPLLLSVVARDSFGVESKPIDVEVTCIRPAPSLHNLRAGGTTRTEVPFCLTSCPHDFLSR